MAMPKGPKMKQPGLVKGMDGPYPKIKTGPARSLAAKRMKGK